MARLIKADGTETEVKIPAGDRGFKKIQNYIGGFIVPMCVGDRTMYVDEDGLPKRLPINRTASAMAKQMIVGTVVVCRGIDVL